MTVTHPDTGRRMRSTRAVMDDRQMGIHLHKNINSLVRDVIVPSTVVQDSVTEDVLSGTRPNLSSLNPSWRATHRVDPSLSQGMLRRLRSHQVGEVFLDASRWASCRLCYLRWPRTRPLRA